MDFLQFKIVGLLGSKNQCLFLSSVVLAILPLPPSNPLGMFVPKIKIPTQRKVVFFKSRARTSFMLHQNHIGTKEKSKTVH